MLMVIVIEDFYVLMGASCFLFQYWDIAF